MAKMMDFDNVRWFRDKDEEDTKRKGWAKSDFEAKKQEQNLDKDSQKLLQVVREAEVLTEQLHNLYSMYFAGVEKRPPIEKRQRLETIISQIAQAFKPNSTVKFRCQGVVSHFHSFRDRWDKTLKQIEAGKKALAIVKKKAA